MIGNTWFDVLFTFCIDDNANGAYHQNQNLIERRGGNLKNELLSSSTIHPARLNCHSGATHSNLRYWYVVVWHV